MIEPIAGGPLPTMSRSGQGNGGNDSAAAANAKGAAIAPPGMAAAEAELLESLPPLLAYGVSGQLLTNGQRQMLRNGRGNPADRAGAAQRQAATPDDTHVDREA